MAALIDAGRWRARLRGHLLAKGLCMRPRVAGERPCDRAALLRATPRPFLLLTFNAVVHQTIIPHTFIPAAA